MMDPRLYEGNTTVCTFPIKQNNGSGELIKEHRTYRAPDKDHFLFSRMPISSPNPMFEDYLLESSHRDDSNKWSNIGFGEEISQVESIEVNLTKIIWSSGN